MARRPAQSPFTIQLGQRIKACRVSRNKTAKDFALELNVTEQQYRYYEGGLNRISVEFLVDVAAALDVPVTNLIFGDNIPIIRMTDNFRTFATNY